MPPAIVLLKGRAMVTVLPVAVAVVARKGCVCVGASQFHVIHAGIACIATDAGTATDICEMRCSGE